MNHKPYSLLILIFISIFLFSFRNTDNSTGGLNIYITRTAANRPEIKTDTGGRVVSLDSAQVCFNRYDSLMKAHGFSDQAGQSINIRLKKTSKITTGETFDGKNLQDWLNTTAAQYAAAGKTLMIKVQMGVYDADYLNTYQPDPSLRTANDNRIAIFLIPYDASTGQPVRALTVLPSGSTGTGGTGYDLGGVQP
ncbi:MAG: hypothetical protein Q8926_15790 [Bacteroidota bacterium]|nr:hypothetical protein [Bacteroidota bacterium]